MTRSIMRVLAVLAVSTASGNQVVVPSGFQTGGGYLRRFADPRDSGYAQGYLDGLFAAALLGAPDAKPMRLKRCVEGMDDHQLAAVFEAYIRAHPEKWDEDMASLGYRSILAEACRSRGFGL